MNSHSLNPCGTPVPPEKSPDVSTNYFDIQGVDKSALLNETYRVRFQVYCLEQGFLAAQDYPDHEETDLFDVRAIHVLARHKRGQSAGTFRLVLYSPSGFPLQGHCIFDEAFAFLRDPVSPVLATYGEISRLAISKLFRRRIGDSFYGGEARGSDLSLSEQVVANPSLGPEIVTGLFKYLYQESKRRGITHWLVAMERSLDIMLRRMAFHFTPVGPEVDYYGPIRPFFAEIAALERSLFKRSPAKLDYMMEGLPEHLRPDWLRGGTV